MIEGCSYTQWSHTKIQESASLEDEIWKGM